MAHVFLVIALALGVQNAFEWNKSNAQKRREPPKPCITQEQLDKITQRTGGYEITVEEFCNP